MACSDVIELSLKPHRHVGGIFSMVEERDRCGNLKKTVIPRLFTNTRILTGPYNSTHNSMQAYVSLRHHVLVA